MLFAPHTEVRKMREISDVITGVVNTLNWVNGPSVLWESSIVADINFFLMKEKQMKRTFSCY